MQSALDQLSKPRTNLDLLADPVAKPTPTGSFYADTTGVSPLVKRDPSLLERGVEAVRGVSRGFNEGLANLTQPIVSGVGGALGFPDEMTARPKRVGLDPRWDDTNPNVNETLTTKAGEMVGSMAPIAALGAVTGGAGLGAAATTGVMAGAAGTQSGVAAYYDAKAHDATPEVAYTAAIANGALGAALMALPISRVVGNILGRAEAAGGDVVRRSIMELMMRSGETGVIGATAGGAQTIASNAIAGVLYDEERPLFAGAVDSAILGGLAGAFGEAVTAPRQKRNTTTTGEPEPMAPPDLQGALQEQEAAGKAKLEAYKARQAARQQDETVRATAAQSAAELQSELYGETSREAQRQHRDKLRKLDEVIRTPGADETQIRAATEARSREIERYNADEDTRATAVQSASELNSELLHNRRYEEARAVADERAALLADPDVTAYTAAEAKRKLATMPPDPAERQPPPQINLPPERWWETVQRVTQDKFNRPVRVNKTVAEATGQPVPQQQDVVAHEALRRGRIAAQERAFDTEIERPLAAELRRANVSVDDAGDFVYALGVGQRDATIMARSNVPDGSGYPGGQVAADALVQKRLSGPQAATYRRIREFNREVNKRKLDLLVRTGKLSPTARAAWERDFGPDYSPAKTDESVVPDYLNETRGTGTGTGLAVRSPEAIKAKGRSTAADNPLLHNLTDYRRSLIRSQKNVVARKLLRLAQANPGLGWEVKPAPAGFMERQQMFNDPHNVPVWHGGDLQFVNVGDPLAARAFQNIGDAQLGPVMQKVTKAMRVYTGFRTAYSPEFIARNPVRDIQTAFAHLGADRSVSMARDAFKNTGRAIRGVWEELRTPGGNGEYAKAYRELRENGGLTSVYGSPDFRATAANLESLGRQEVPKTSFERSLKGARAVKTWLEDAGSAFEHGVRLSAYAELRKSGVGRIEAANIVKDMTVNFESRGEYGQNINALYPFFKVGASATERSMRWISTPRGRKAAATIFAAGVAQAWLSRRLAGDDEEGQSLLDKVSPEVRARNSVFPLPEGMSDKLPFVHLTEDQTPYIAIPYGQGMIGAIFNAAGNVEALAENAANPRKGMTAAQAAANTVGHSLDNLSPVGGGTPLQTVLPWFMDPAAQAYENKTAFGSAAHPEQFPGDNTPDSSLAFERTGPTARAVAKGINAATGGDEFESGAIDIHPETIEAVANELGGATGSFLRRAIEMMVNTAQGKGTDLSQIPMSRAFLSTTGEGELTRKFYDNLRVVAVEKARRKGADVEGSLAELETSASKFKSDIAKMRSAAREAATDDERGQIQREMYARMRAFNARVLDVQHPKK